MIHREDEGAVAVLRMEHGKVNALDSELLAALEESLARVEDDGAAAVVLTGTGSVFSAGVDLWRVLDGGAGYLDGFLPAISRALTRLFTFPRPVVAAVNGHAIAGGAVLVEACDLRMMARGGGRIGVPELSVGVPFPAAALEILRFATPVAALQDLIYRGRVYEAAEARDRGLIDLLSEDEDLLHRALVQARELAALPAASFRITKEHLRRPTMERLERLAAEIDAEVLAEWSDPEAHRHIRAYLDAHLHKRGEGRREKRR